MNAPRPAPNPQERHIYLTLTAILQVLLLVGLVLFVLRRDWENVFLTAAVIVLTLAPAFLDRQYRIIVPPEFNTREGEAPAEPNESRHPHFPAAPQERPPSRNARFWRMARASCSRGEG